MSAAPAVWPASSNSPCLDEDFFNYSILRLVWNGSPHFPRAGAAQDQSPEGSRGVWVRPIWRARPSARREWEPALNLRPPPSAVHARWWYTGLAPVRVVSGAFGSCSDVRKLERKEKDACLPLVKYSATSSIALQLWPVYSRFSSLWPMALLFVTYCDLLQRSYGLRAGPNALQPSLPLIISRGQSGFAVDLMQLRAVGRGTRLNGAD